MHVKTGNEHLLIILLLIKFGKSRVFILIILSVFGGTKWSTKVVTVFEARGGLRSDVQVLIQQFNAYPLSLHHHNKV